MSIYLLFAGFCLSFWVFFAACVLWAPVVVCGSALAVFGLFTLGILLTVSHA